MTLKAKASRAAPSFHLYATKHGLELFWVLTSPLVTFGDNDVAEKGSLNLSNTRQETGTERGSVGK